MFPTIYFACKCLKFLKQSDFDTLNPCDRGVAWHIAHDGELSRAKILKIFETNNTIHVICSEPEAEFESFKSNFREVVAAGGALVAPDGDILMIYRNAKWDLPKGHWELGETIEECALREVEEETSVKPDRLHHLLCKTWHAYNLRGVWEIKLTHWYKMSVVDKLPPTPQDEEGITLAEWCSRREAIKRAMGSYPTIQRVFESLD